MDSVDDVSINYVAQPNCQGILLALVPWTTDADFVAIVRTLLSRYGIELVFFSRLKNQRPYPAKPKLERFHDYRFL